MNKLSPEVFSMLIDLKLADNASKTEKAPARFGEAKKLRAIMEEIRKTDACFSLKQLKINGDNIVKLGIPKGRLIGEVLDTLLSEVISGECENSEEALKTRAMEIIKNKNEIK
jgi:tRNA nucleotidyltransferase (CCA-adding enzyme)